MVLFLVAGILLQDKTPEGTFKRLEERIDKATTLSIRLGYKELVSAGKPGVPPAEMETRAVILLKKENRVHLKVEPSPMFKGGQCDMGVHSDGSRLLVTDVLGQVETSAAPKNLTASFKTIVARVGYFGAQQFIPRRPALGPEVGKEPDLKGFLEKDLKKVFEVSDIQGLTENGEHFLRYSLKVSGEKGVFLVNLWYDPKTFTLRKRNLVMPFGGMRIVHTETYEEFTIDGDLPDEKFRLPEEKK